MVHLGVCQRQIKRDGIRKDDLWSLHWFVARERWSCFSPSHSILRREDERWSAREEEIRRNDTSDAGYVSNPQRCQTLTPYQSLSVYVCNLPESPLSLPHRLQEENTGKIPYGSWHSIWKSYKKRPLTDAGTLSANNPKTKEALNRSVFIICSNLNTFCKLSFNWKSCLFGIDFST